MKWLLFSVILFQCFHFLQDNSFNAETDTKAVEERCLVWALHQVVGPQVAENDQTALSILLHDLFPQVAGWVLKGEDSDKEELPLVEAIREVMREDRLKEIEPLVQKVKFVGYHFYTLSASAIIREPGSKIFNVVIILPYRPISCRGT